MESVQNKKLNILVWYWGRRGGAPKETLEIVKAFSSMDDVNVYTSLCLENELYYDITEYSADSFDVSIYPNKVKLVFNLLKMPMYKAQFKKFLVKNKIDFVYCTMGHFANPYIATVLKDLHIPYIFTVHDANNHPGEVRKSYTKEVLRNTTQADLVLVHSDNVKDILNSSYGIDESKMIVLPLGAYQYNDNYVPRKLPKDRPVRLLFFGRIVKYKGLGLAIDTYHLLKNKGYNVELEIAGSGDVTEYQSDISNDPGIINNVRWIDDSEIKDIFSRADITLLPYIEASQSGVVAISADMGVPMVATPVGGLLKQVESTHGGLISQDVTGKSLAMECEKLLNDSENYSLLSQNCINTALNGMSWTAICRRLIERYNHDYN